MFLIIEKYCRVLKSTEVKGMDKDFFSSYMWTNVQEIKSFVILTKPVLKPNKVGLFESSFFSYGILYSDYTTFVVKGLL